MELVMMPKDKAVKALEQPENEVVESTIEPILRKHLDREVWEEIIILQHLDQSSPLLEGWNGLFSRALKSPDYFFRTKWRIYFRGIWCTRSTS
jgi:hypothetical protein